MAKRRGRKPGLTAKQELFCREYLVDLNAEAAAKRAGYAAKNAAREGCMLLKKPHVVQLVERLKSRQYQRLELKADNVLQELARIGFLDPAHVFDLQGVMLPIHEMPEEIRRAISSIEVETLYGGRGEAREAVGQLTKIKFWSKVDALQALGKHFNLWVERLEISGRVDVATALREARERRTKGATAV